jgi:phospholipid/cholesterol/gamma-HCH transport system substrate-binding protein
MQDSRINYVVVGSFVAVMLAAFVVIVSMLAGRGGSTDDYYTVYDNVTGLKYGTAVLYEGFQIGQVSSIEPESGEKVESDNKKVRFRVNIEVKAGWKIPEDSVARAIVSGLLSAMTIDIRGGTSTQLLKPGDLIKGVSPTNFFATLSDLSAEFGDLSNTSLKPLLQNLNTLIGNINKSTGDRLPAIVKDLNTIMDALARDMPGITESIKNSAKIVETDVLKPENRDHISAILANADQASHDIAQMTSQLDQTRKSINETTARVNKLVQDNAGNIDESIRDLRYTLGTLARFVDDIAQNADETSRNLAEFSRAIRENPGIFINSGTQPDQAKRKK